MTKYGTLKNVNVRKYYIFTRPAKVADFRETDWFEDEPQDRWLEKSRHMQARRWRKIKHQLV